MTETHTLLGTGSDVISRIEAVLSQIDLDCSCRERLFSALQSFASIERLRERRMYLQDARSQVAAILSILDLLGELDVIGLQEKDHTVFLEVAHLFEDVAEAAERGAEDMRKLGSGQSR